MVCPFFLPKPLLHLFHSPCPPPSHPGRCSPFSLRRAPHRQTPRAASPRVRVRSSPRRTPVEVIIVRPSGARAPCRRRVRIRGVPDHCCDSRSLFLIVVLLVWIVAPLCYCCCCCCCHCGGAVLALRCVCAASPLALASGCSVVSLDALVPVTRSFARPSHRSRAQSSELSSRRASVAGLNGLGPSSA